jgi:hypothetical protein
LGHTALVSSAFAYKNEIHQQRYRDGTSIEYHFKNFRLLVAQYRTVRGTISDVSVVIAILRTFNDSAAYKGIITTIRMNTKLEELTLDEIETKMVIDARDIDVESKVGSAEHPNICRALIMEEPIIHLKGAESNILTRDPKQKTGKFPKKKGYKKDSDESEGAGATMHQVYSVLARTGPEEWTLRIICSYDLNQVIAQGLQRSCNDYRDRCKWRYSACKRSRKYLLQNPTWLRHFYKCFTRTRTGSKPHLVPQLTSKGLTIRLLKDKCAISGKQGNVMSVKKSGFFCNGDSDTAQVAVTETPKTEIPRFPDDVKYSTELYLWHQRFGHLASKM